MATVVLADDHALVRAGLRRILEPNGNVVVGAAGDGLQVIPCKKVGFGSQTDVVLYALRRGILDLDDPEVLPTTIN